MYVKLVILSYFFLCWLCLIWVKYWQTWELWKDGACSELVDPSIKESIDADEVQRCVHIGLLCVEHYAEDRPTMSEVVSMLTNKSAIVSLPQTPAFYVGRKIRHDNLSSKGYCTDSTTEITTSTMDTTDFLIKSRWIIYL